MATNTKRVYPHVPDIKDRPTQNTTRLIWDKIFDHADTLTAMNATIKSANDLIATQAKSIAALQAQLNRVSIVAGKKTDMTGGIIGGGGGTGGGGGGGSNDGGAGQDGCVNCGVDGHPASGLTLDNRTAGLIVCGTGNEFPALLAVTIDQPTRDANALELLERVIWHLQQYGFLAGRQRNPSGVVSQDKITIQISGVWWAYDIYPGVDYTVPLVMQMVPVTPPNTVDDGGISD